MMISIITLPSLLVLYSSINILSFKIIDLNTVSQSDQAAGDQYFPYNKDHVTTNLLYNGTLSKLGPSKTII